MDTQTLLDSKMDYHRQAIRTNSVYKEALATRKPKQCRWSGHKQNPVVRSDQSRNYGGAVNIANALKAEAELYERELLAYTYEVEQERASRRAKGYKDTIRKYQKDKLSELQSKIFKLKAQSKELKGEGFEVAHNFQKPKANFILVKKSS